MFAAFAMDIWVADFANLQNQNFYYPDVTFATLATYYI
jgi:hypothetical protein